MVRAIPLLLRAAPAAAVATAAIDAVASLTSQGVTDAVLLYHRILSHAAEAAATALAPHRPAEAEVLLQELELEFDYEVLAYLGAARRLDEAGLRALLQQRG
jgi:hypothetical protein